MKIWKQFLIVWVAAWPLAVIALLIDRHVKGWPDMLDTAIIVGAGLYALLGWAPVVLTFRDSKR